jgi:cobalt-zinc-cadmium efflux system outer membrane protein
MGQSAAVADTVPPGDVEAFVADVLAHAPSLAALQAHGAAAVQGIRAAGALPDPMLEFMLQDVGFPTLTLGREEMSMAGVEVTQGLLWPGKRRARTAAAAAEAGVAATEITVFRRQLAAETRMLGAALYALDRERDLLNSSRELLDMLAATVTARYTTGEEDQEAVLKQQLAVVRLDERLADLVASRAGLAAEINRLRGRSGAATVGVIASLPDVEPPAPAPEATAAANAAEVVVRRAGLQAAQARLTLARTEQRPNAVAAAGYGYRNGFDRVVTLRFGLELPLWSGRKQEPQTRAAAYELEAAKHELAAAEAAADAETTRLAAEWRRDEAQVLLYRESILPRTSAAFDAARANYLVGRADFATVAEDFRMWLEARVELARREADRFSVWARIAALVGEPAPGTTGAQNGAAGARRE